MTYEPEHIDLSAGNFQQEVTKNTDVSKCPACGANMVWSPEDMSLYCEHCGTRQEVKSGGAEELAFERLLSDKNAWTGETHVFRCENCGAMEVLDRGEIAKECSFCGATNIVETTELPGLKPNALIPFTFSRDDACENAKKWAKKHIFAPRSFKKSLSPQEVRGIYSPAFTFDTDTFSTYSGRLGKYHTRTRRVNGKTVTERYLRYFNVSGVFNRSFDDILIQASSRIDQKTVNKLLPYDTNSSMEYKKEFLSGFTANQYSKDGLTCWNEAKNIIYANLRRAILAKYNYDVVDFLNVSTECSNITYKYLLLPLWVGHFGFRKKLYNFFVNGKNGKVAGKTPVSPLRVGLAVLLGLAVVTGLALLAWFNLF